MEYRESQLVLEARLGLHGHCGFGTVLRGKPVQSSLDFKLNICLGAE